MPDLFAGIPVNDYETALIWYEKLFGCSPSFRPHDTEAVWELAEHQYIYIVQKPEHAGHGMLTYMVDNLKLLTEEISGRGLNPDKLENYPNGICKITYRDPDGNELGFGGPRF